MNSKILIADDHAIVRDGISIQLERLYPDHHIDEVGDGPALIERVRANRYDLVTLDINMPNSEPLSTVSELLHIQPDLPILVFSMYPERIFAFRLLRMGIKGYVSKQVSNNELISAIKIVMNNETYYSAPVKELLADFAISGKSANVFNKLSDREFEVMLFLVNGKGPKEISNILNIHPSTIGTHRFRIFEKTGVKSLVELTQLAISHKII